MPHANARLTVHGRRLAVERVHAGWRVADVAAQLGCSRTTIYKWLARYAAAGSAGLIERTSRPHRTPTRTRPGKERAVIDLRVTHRLGREEIARRVGVSARTAGRIIARAGLAALADIDPLSGLPVRARRMSHVRYERSRPGELVHVDVKKLGRIPAGGGWRAHGRRRRPNRKRRVGIDCVHSAVDDHSRLAYSEVLPDERGVTCAGFLLRAAAFFAAHGITHIERVMTDNAFNYRLSRDFQAALGEIDARHVLIRPHCPWTNGKVERFNRTLQREWAYARAYTSNRQRTRALKDWLRYYNRERRHSALGDQPPTSRLPTT